MNFAHGFGKAQIFALRVCSHQLLFLDVLRVSLAQRGSKERCAAMCSEQWILTSTCALWMTVLFFFVKNLLFPA